MRTTLKTGTSLSIRRSLRMKFGKGRVVVFGEAAMFTAQLAGSQRIQFGISHEAARDNYRLLLNVIHWLDSKLE